MSVLNQSGEEQVECPLCMEPLEVDDLNFYPCTCGYQICRFCWHRIRTDENGLCPACRKPYSENPADFTPLSQEQVAQLKQEKRQRDQQRKAKLTESRKHLASVRVVQRNLVFVVGLPMRLADAEVLKKHEYFGKFGKIHKVVINQSTTYAGSQGPSASAYVTYLKSDDALRAIMSVNNITLDGRLIKSSLGTTKYCSHFMKNQSCPKSDCMYLHDYGDPEASFTKEQMQAGRHQEYEKRLHDALSAKMALQSAPPGMGNGTLPTEKAGSPTGNTAKTKDSKENKETWPQLNTDTNGTTTGAKGNESKETSSNSTNNSNSSGKSKDSSTSNGKSGNRSNKAKTKRNNNNNNHSSSNNNHHNSNSSQHSNHSNSSGNNCQQQQQQHNSSGNCKTESEVVKEGGGSHRTLSDSESVSTSSSMADLPVTGITHSSLSGNSSNGSVDGQQRINNQSASNSSLIDDNNSFFSSQNSYQRLDLLHNNLLQYQDIQLLSQHLQDDSTSTGTSINGSTTQPPSIPTNTLPVTSSPNTSQHQQHLNNHLNHLLSSAPVTGIPPPTIPSVIDTMEERWEAAFGFSKHSNHLEELAQQRTGSVVGKQQQELLPSNGNSGFGQVQYGGDGFGGLAEENTAKLMQQLQQSNRENMMYKEYMKMLPQQNGISLPPSQQNGYNLHNGYAEKTLLYLQHQQQQQRHIEEQLLNLNLSLKNQQQQQQQQQQPFHSRLGNILHPGQPTTTTTTDPTSRPPISLYLNGIFNQSSASNQPNSYQQHNGDQQQPPHLPNGYNTINTPGNGLFGNKAQQLPQRPLADDELGFDPFQESQKGLAEFIENEQTVNGLLGGFGLNSVPLNGGKVLNVRSNLSNGMSHGPNGLNTHHLPPPPPGFSQSTTHMNSFGSKILPFLNMSNQQQQLGNNLTGTNNWANNSFNHLHQQHKGLSNPQQTSCNDWKVLDPAILSSSRHLPPLSTLRNSNQPPNGTANDYLSTTYNRSNSYSNNTDSNTTNSSSVSNSFGNMFNSNSAAALAAMAQRYQLEQQQQQQQQQMFNQQQQQYYNTHAQISSPPPGFRSTAAGAAGATAAAAAGIQQQEC